ncbi:MAG: aspartate aminotransferase family protein [Geminicoccaceae bacterium]
MPTDPDILSLNAFDPAGDAPADPVTAALLARRQANLGPVSVLFYEEPLHIVRAEGVWLEAKDGRRYLDVYNNVASVGHCHPRVVAAIAEQAATLNVHTRYLNEPTETYVERLKATLPPELSTVALTCSGSEANDLALRLARKATGRQGVVVTAAAYHGNTAAVSEISPSAFRQGGPPAHIRMVPAPDARHYGADLAGGFAADIERAIGELDAAGFGCAAFIADSIFSSDGVHADPADFLRAAAAVVRTAGGLYIADEVQPGFARTGDAFWGFARHGITPDIVTMGKPMGNGFPVAGLAARPEVMAPYFAEFGYFNTFGGNPVAAAAGLAVLDVIADQALQQNAAATGGYLREKLERLRAGHPSIAAVRGAGLFLGVALCRASDPEVPDPSAARRVINGLRRRGVLVGACGRYGETLKIRPPLTFTPDHADQLVAALEETLAG